MKQIWSSQEKKVFRKLNTPPKIQQYLDSNAYNVDGITRSPREVMRLKRAHCFDGAIFGACALEQLGFPPLLIDLRCDGYNDDHHVLAVFKRRGLWGAVGKSNYTGCRYRDPVYRTLRELVMSYFNVYFNLAGIKTLRDYSVPLDLRRVKDLDWRTSTDDLTRLGDYLESLRHFPIIPRAAIRDLAPADDRLFKAETLGLDPRGAFKLKSRRKLG